MEKGETKSQNINEKSLSEKKKDFDNIVKMYLESNPVLKKGNLSNELEIRFGTNYKIGQPITKIEYDNVVQRLYHEGFKTNNSSGNQMLRIQNEYINKLNGKKMISNVRAEITGSNMIQEYCKTNNLQKLIDMPSTQFNMIKFTQKKPAISNNGEIIKKVDMDDFNFRVSFQTEQDYHTHTNLAREILSKWDDSLKIFRAMNRVRFYHEELPVFIDLSIVRSSRDKKHVAIPKYTIQEAGVFENIEKYEIEIEVDNSKVGVNTIYEDPKKLADVLRKSIRIIMCGIQNTNYPVSYKEKSDILEKYFHLFHDPTVTRKITSKDFIGPSSYTLEMENIVDSNENNIPNIRNNYTVTDKADGDRKLLYVSEDGKLYLIDTNMKVNFTGAKTSEKKLFNSLLDGEHILYDKNGKFLNMYAAFDIYYKHEESVRELEFINIDDETVENPEPVDKSKYRLYLLKEFVEDLKIYSILDKKNSGNEVKTSANNKPLPILITCKEFIVQSKNISIFDGCSTILSKVKDNIFKYNTDGLIFTPANIAVGSDKVGGLPGPLSKNTWIHSFKWKPPEFNTVDFLVSIKKDKTGKDEIHNIFQEGKNATGSQNILQYKTLILRCGFDEKKHGYLNPFNDLINDNVSYNKNVDDTNSYQPVAFQPTNPYDENAKYCNIYLKDEGSKQLLITEEGEYFEEDMIVEFKYEPSNEIGWRWIPLRVRFDKTADLRSGMKNYGNAYHVANSNWHSIHNPITESMITTGLDIPDYFGDEDVYYNRSMMKTSTQGLRDFHNLYVKSKLINGVSNRGDTLIDYAVGKGGDLPKWIRSKLKFVFGIDISKDNIFNQLNGACSRYLNASKQYEKIPRAMFLHGNSGKNIRDGSAYYTEKDKQISKAIFGLGSKDPAILGQGVYKNYGIGETGLQISSCQFALHYFFENIETMHSFIRNVSECTKVHGYFIGTCYDGRSVFNKLKDKNMGESVTIFKDDYKIYELTKRYDQTGFPDDELSLGYSIDVYQESINKVFREYLVNFEYLTQIMEDYGFVLLNEEEAKQMNLPNPTGLFSELYSSMETEIKINPSKKADYKEAVYMGAEEKQISFMNRYFIFKKMRNVDAKKMEKIIQKDIQIENVPDFTEQLNSETQKGPIFIKSNKTIQIKKPITMQ
jgi:hypothetical protein